MKNHLNVILGNSRLVSLNYNRNFVRKIKQNDKQENIEFRNDIIKKSGKYCWPYKENSQNSHNKVINKIFSKPQR